MDPDDCAVSLCAVVEMLRPDCDANEHCLKSNQTQERYLQVKATMVNQWKAVGLDRFAQGWLTDELRIMPSR